MNQSGAQIAERISHAETLSEERVDLDTELSAKNEERRQAPQDRVRVLQREIEAVRERKLALGEDEKAVATALEHVGARLAAADTVAMSVQAIGEIRSAVEQGRLAASEAAMIYVRRIVGKRCCIA